jgi:hypothetical protein
MVDGEIIEVRIVCTYTNRNAVAENVQKGLSNMGFHPLTYPRYMRSRQNDCNTLIYQSFVATQLDY